MELSNRTIAALIECIASSYRHSELDVLMVRLECEGVDINEEGQRGNKLDRAGRLVARLRNRMDGPNVVDLLRELLEVRFEGRVLDSVGKPKPTVARLIESLQTDGYEMVDGRLLATTPGPAVLAPELSLLERQLTARGLDVSLAHYQQAIDSFVDSRLEASNGQLRSFLEDFLVVLCDEVTGAAAHDARGATERLRNHGALDGDEARLLAGLAGVSNARGAHRGLTDLDEALFRLHVTTATARYLLARIPPPRPRRQQ